VSRKLLKPREFSVEAPGIEPPATGASRVANSRENDATDATKDDPKRPEVSASLPPAAPATDADTDAAIRAAVRVALDAADYRRARALIDLLETKLPEKTPIVAFASKRAPA